MYLGDNMKQVTKKQIAITVDKVTVEQIEAYCEEHMIPLSRFFNKIMINSWTKMNQQRTLENFKEV